MLSLSFSSISFVSFTIKSDFIFSNSFSFLSFSSWIFSIDFCLSFIKFSTLLMFSFLSKSIRCSLSLISISNFSMHFLPLLISFFKVEFSFSSSDIFFLCKIVSIKLPSVNFEFATIRSFFETRSESLRSSSFSFICSSCIFNISFSSWASFMRSEELFSFTFATNSSIRLFKFSISSSFSLIIFSTPKRFWLLVFRTEIIVMLTGSNVVVFGSSFVDFSEYISCIFSLMCLISVSFLAIVFSKSSDFFLRPLISKFKALMFCELFVDEFCPNLSSFILSFSSAEYCKILNW